jgi:putative cofactor-binding repeat protein
LNLDYSAATLSGNVIMSNTASAGGSGRGGGLFLFYSNVTLSGNTVAGNVGGAGGFSQGGGLFIQYGIVTVSGNTVRGDAARTPNLGFGGGLYVVYGDALTLDGNWITDNAAESGAGILVHQGSTFILTNNVVAGNRIMLQGNGLHVFGNAAYAPTIGILLHNTIADNTRGSSEGLYVWGGNVALTLTNNIVAGHAVGITNTDPVSSTVAADHTLFHGNTTDHGSGVTSTNEVNGDPRFVNSMALNYYIGPGSGNRCWHSYPLADQ